MRQSFPPVDMPSPTIPHPSADELVAFAQGALVEPLVSGRGACRSVRALRECRCRGAERCAYRAATAVAAFGAGRRSWTEAGDSLFSRRTKKGKQSLARFWQGRTSSGRPRRACPFAKRASRASAVRIQKASGDRGDGGGLPGLRSPDGEIGRCQGVQARIGRQTRTQEPVLSRNSHRHATSPSEYRTSSPRSSGRKETVRERRPRQSSSRWNTSKAKRSPSLSPGKGHCRWCKRPIMFAKRPAGCNMPTK